MIIKFDTLNELWIVFHQKGHAFVIFWASLQLFNTAMIRRIFSVLMQNDILISVVETLLFFIFGHFRLRFWLLPLAVIVLFDDKRRRRRQWRRRWWWWKKATSKNFHYDESGELMRHTAIVRSSIHWAIIVCRFTYHFDCSPYSN